MKIDRSLKRRLILTAGVAALIALATLPIFVFRSGRAKTVAVEGISTPSVVIVFGAGLTRDGRPSDILRDRLRTAAAVYEAGKATAIIVSGDNRFENYDEPTAMRDYLVDALHVPSDMVVTDFAGRRTYDTCARAHELWGVDHAVLVTQDFHLPRAIWLCEKLGIKSLGVSASLQSYRGERTFTLREIPAIYNAWIDIFLWKPSYMHGDFEHDLDLITR